MQVRKILSALALAMVTLGGCAQALPTPVTQQLRPTGSLQTLDSRLGGDRTGWVHIGAAQREVLNTVYAHRWVANDVYEYRLALAIRDGNGQFVPTSPPISLTLAAKGSNLSTGAAIVGLAADSYYRLSLEAWGNEGGTSADTLLNAVTSSTADFDFTGSNNLQTSYSVTMNAQLDGLVVNGAAEISLGPTGDATVTCQPAGATCTVTIEQPSGLYVINDTDDGAATGSVAVGNI